MDAPYIDPDCQSVVTLMEDIIPFNKHLGLRVHAMRPGYCVLVIPFGPNLIGDPLRPALHGGVISTLIDTTGGGACFAALTDPRDRVSTVDLRVDYLRPGPKADLYCEARVIRMGNRVAVVRMGAFSGGLPEHGTPERDQPIATGQGVYNVVRHNGPRKG